MTYKELEKIYNEAYRSVYWTALSLLKNEADAEDIVQDTFVTAYTSYDTLMDKSKAVAWLKKIAANKCLNRLTRTKTVNAEDEYFDSIEAIPEDFLPDSIIESDEKRKIIMDIIDRELSDDVRRTIILFYFDEMSTGEIAEVLNIPQGTVLSRLNFAKKKIKKEVEKYEKENDDKLFAMAVPFLSKLFLKEAEQVPLRPMPVSLIDLSASEAKPTGKVGNKIAAVPAAAAEKGTGYMFKKIIISVVSLLLVGTATAVTIRNFNPAKANKKAETDITSQEGVVQADEEISDVTTDVEETDQSEATDFDSVPVDGYIRYRYSTDPSTGERTLIGEMRVTDSGEILSNREYDLQGNITICYTSEYDDDMNNTFTYYYDEAGELSSYLEYEYGEYGISGYTSYHIGDDGEFHTSGNTIFEYDDQGRLTETCTYSVTGQLSGRQEYVYSDDGSCIHYMYSGVECTEVLNYEVINADGVRTELHYPVSSTRSVEEVYYYYDGRYDKYEGDELVRYGIFEKDENGHTSVETDYDPDGNVTKIIEYEYVYG